MKFSGTKGIILTQMQTLNVNINLKDDNIKDDTIIKIIFDDDTSFDLTKKELKKLLTKNEILKDEN